MKDANLTDFETCGAQFLTMIYLYTSESSKGSDLFLENEIEHHDHHNRPKRLISHTWHFLPVNSKSISSNSSNVEAKYLFNELKSTQNDLKDETNVSAEMFEVHTEKDKPKIKKIKT